MNKNIDKFYKLKIKILVFLICIIIIFLFSFVTTFLITTNSILHYEYYNIKDIIKLLNINYDPLDLMNQKRELENNKSYIKIINYRAPIFEINGWFLFGSGLNTWSTYFNSYNLFLTELKENLISQNQYLKKTNEMEYFIYNKNRPTNEAFLKQKFKNHELMNHIINQETNNYINKSINMISKDPYFKFPERNAKLNKLEYTLNHFPISYAWINEKDRSSFSNQHLSGVSRLYSNYQEALINFENESNLIKINEIEKYFFYYDKKFTNYIQEKYQNKNLIYHIPKIQIFHLTQLNYNEIQYILYLIHDVPYFKNRTFIDVHWEIFNGTSYKAEEALRKITLSTLSSDYINLLHIKHKLRYYLTKIMHIDDNSKLGNWLMSETPKTIGFYNPFQINFPGIMDFNKLQKKYYFTEESLRILPIHILSNINHHILFDHIIVSNIYEQSKSNNFWNILSNSGNTFVERLFKYTEYGKYSPTSIRFFSKSSEHIETPYEKCFFLSHNPWWDCLTLSTQQKMKNLFQLEEKQVNELFINLIDRFFENKYFFSHEEIEKLLPKLKDDEEEI